MKYRLKGWTGPTAVNEITDACQRAGLEDATAGTEHVYVTVEAMHSDSAGHNASVDLMRKFGTDFGVRWTVIGLAEKLNER